MHNYVPSTIIAPTVCPVVDDGDPPTAANLSAADKCNADGVGYLNAVKAPLASPTFTGTVTLPDCILQAGKLFTCQATSNITELGTLTIAGSTGVLAIGAGGTLDMTAGTSVIKNSNLVSLADANATLDLTTGGQRIVMRTSPVANRVLTLKQTGGTAPPDGYWFEVSVFLGTSARTVSLQREGAVGTFVAVLGDGVGNTPWGSSNQVASVRVKKEAGVWRLEFAGAGPCFFGGDA
jgi:hypothetical protein